MKSARQEVFQELARQDNHFKKFFEQHRDLDNKLQTLAKRLYLTEEQQSEISRLKKLKLKSKDAMEALLAKHQNRVSDSGIHHRT